MGTLLLRLAAPLQSWGVDSKFETRRTEREPSKSGVVGMLAAALGRSRNEAVDDLNALKFGVRVDREGKLLTDFHIARPVKSLYVPTPPTPYITYRHYLQDAVFLVGLYGDDDLLRELDEALKNPYYPLYLGRRSCPPTLPLCLGIRDCGLIEALETEKPLVIERRGNNSDNELRIVTEASEGEKADGTVRDLPLSFGVEKREYGYRTVKLRTPYKVSEKQKSDGAETLHDPMSELR